MDTLYTKKTLIEILNKAKVWSDEFDNWLNFEEDYSGEKFTGDDMYIYDEMALCSEGIYFIKYYLEGFNDDDIIDIDIMSDKVTQAIIDAANEGIDILNETVYFDDWESVLICAQTAWEHVEDSQFPIKY